MNFLKLPSCRRLEWGLPGIGHYRFPLAIDSKVVRISKFSDFRSRCSTRGSAPCLSSCHAVELSDARIKVSIADVMCHRRPRDVGRSIEHGVHGRGGDWRAGIGARPPLVPPSEVNSVRSSGFNLMTDIRRLSTTTNWSFLSNHTECA